MEGVAGRWRDGGSTAKPVDVAESKFGDECDAELKQSRVRGRVRLWWRYELGCNDHDAGDHPGVLTAAQSTKPRGERPGLCRRPLTPQQGRAPCMTIASWAES
jgi:hypothetical protein